MFRGVTDVAKELTTSRIRKHFHGIGVLPTPLDAGHTRNGRDITDRLCVQVTER
ncbi:MAG: hypothetical protein RLZZ201_135 [Actinomycetota bacterium]